MGHETLPKKESFFIKMKKLITLIIFVLLAQPRAVLAGDLIAGSSACPRERITEKVIDLRVEKLRGYLTKQKSPLAEYADFFIKTADKYGLSDYDLDYLLPAISGVESSFAKFYPRGTFNAYGWDSGRYYFSSWENSIEHISRVLREKYIARGADTVYKIGPIYAESPTWSQRVSYFMEQIKLSNPLGSNTVFTI